MSPAGAWSTHQLAEFVAALSKHGDVSAVLTCAVERAAEAVEAEIAVALRGSQVLAAVGIQPAQLPAELREPVARGAAPTVIDLPGLGSCHLAVVRLDGDEDGDDLRLVVVRAAPEAFDPLDLALLRAMCRVLAQTTTLLTSLERERERQRLLDRLSRIQRSISHRAPLQDVLDGITAGASDLLGDGGEIVGLRLIDPDDPDQCYLASHAGMSPELIDGVMRNPLGQGAGGRAITEDRLVIIDDYQHDDNIVPALRDAGLTAAIAAPVHEHGQVVGSLVVSSRRPGRRYTDEEQEALLALAEHTSLALTDAKTVDAMREAQRSKDLFLAMVSHELKTPLTVIMGALRTLQQYGESLPVDMRQDMLSTAFGRGRELERLIDRLLRGARAELAGARRDVPLTELLDGALAGFAQVRRLAVTAPEGTVVHVDAAAMQDVVGILVENAVAHSSAASPIVVEAAVDDAETRITVANEGALPSDLDPATLFLPFQRGSDATSSGVGLGLYIAARLAEAMGGRIEPESGDGQVSFTLRVPRHGELRLAPYRGRRAPVANPQ